MTLLYVNLLHRQPIYMALLSCKGLIQPHYFIYLDQIIAVSFHWCCTLSFGLTNKLLFVSLMDTIELEQHVCLLTRLSCTDFFSTFISLS